MRVAKRRTDKGSALLLVFLLILAAIAVIGPFVIAGWTIFAELRARKFRGADRASQLITTDENAALSRYESELAGREARRQRVLNEGLSSGFLRRQDGWFDERNPRARDLNFELRSLEREQLGISADFEAFKGKLSARIDQWLTARSSVVGMRAAIIVFVVAFVLLTIGRLSDHSSAVNLSTIMFGNGADGSDRIVASGVATAAAALAMWIARSIARSALA